MKKNSFAGLSDVKSLVKSKSSVSENASLHLNCTAFYQACLLLKTNNSIILTSRIRYRDLVPNEPAGAEAGARSRLVMSSMMSSEMYNEIKELYITAAQRAPEKDIDSNVQASTMCSVSVTTQMKGAQSRHRAPLKVVEICVRLRIFAKRLQHQTQKLNILIHGLKGRHTRGDQSLRLVPANKSRGLVPSCELASFALKSSRRDQSFVPATSPTNSNHFEFFFYNDNVQAIMLYRRIDNDKGTNHVNRLSGTEYLRNLMLMYW